MRKALVGIFVLLSVVGLIAGTACGKMWWSGHGVEGVPPPTLLGPTIASNLTFNAVAGNANSTIGTLSTAISVGTSVPHYTLLTTCGANCAQSSLFAISGVSLNVGTSDIVCGSPPCTYHITVLDADGAPGVVNNPFSQPLTLTNPPPQTIASIGPTSCTLTQGAASSCPLAIAMNPVAPTFASHGGAVALVASNTGCPGSNDTSDFGTSNTPYGITYNGTAAAGSYKACVQASATGIVSAYQQISVAINPPVGTSIACDIGPNYVLQTGTGYSNGIPSPADAAGYRNCVNYDFGSSAYANVSSWLGCSTPGVGFNTTPGFQWYSDSFGENSDVNQIAPCSASIVNDNGVTALKMDWAQSSYNHTNKMFLIQTYTHNNTQVTDFPNGAYYEITARLSVGPVSAVPSCDGSTGACDSAAFWTWTTNNTGGPLEQDFFLIDQNIYFIQDVWYGTPSAGVQTTNNDNLLGNFDTSVYHKFGFRTTTNAGTGGFTFCHYFDSAFLTCRDVAFYFDGSPNSPFTMRHSPILQIGAMNASVAMFVQNVRIWTCANWRTQQCDGPVLSGPP